MAQWGLDYLIGTLSPSYAWLPSNKSEQITKIVWRDMIAYCFTKATFMSSIFLHYQLSTIWLHYHEQTMKWCNPRTWGTTHVNEPLGYHNAINDVKLRVNNSKTKKKTKKKLINFFKYLRFSWILMTHLTIVTQLTLLTR